MGRLACEESYGINKEIYLSIYLGLRGGYLHEYYISLHGNQIDSKLMRDANKAEHLLDHEEESYFFQRYATKFWYFCAKSLHEVNQKCTIPLFSWQMQEEINGLSRIGRNYNQLMGIGLDSRTYDRLKQAMITEYTKRVNQLVKSRKCIIGFDNYTHIYRAVDLNLNRSTDYHQANYTVVGVTELPDNVTISMEPRRLSPKHTLASLPSEVTDLKPFQETVFLFIL